MWLAEITGMDAILPEGINSEHCEQFLAVTMTCITYAKAED
jgi:hypothetical protein